MSVHDLEVWLCDCFTQQELRFVLLKHSMKAQFVNHLPEIAGSTLASWMQDTVALLDRGGWIDEELLGLLKEARPPTKTRKLDAIFAAADAAEEEAQAPIAPVEPIQTTPAAAPVVAKSSRGRWGAVALLALGVTGVAGAAMINLGDSDGDGVANYQDECKDDHEGKYQTNGCPDTDGDNDGVVDEEDECKDVDGGTNSVKGCPDYDNDGIPDNEDSCIKYPPGEDIALNIEGCRIPDIISTAQVRLINVNPGEDEYTIHVDAGQDGFDALDSKSKLGFAKGSALFSVPSGKSRFYIENSDGNTVAYKNFLLEAGKNYSVAFISTPTDDVMVSETSTSEVEADEVRVNVHNITGYQIKNGYFGNYNKERKTYSFFREKDFNIGSKSTVSQNIDFHNEEIRFEISLSEIKLIVHWEVRFVIANHFGKALDIYPVFQNCEIISPNCHAWMIVQSSDKIEVYDPPKDGIGWIP